MPEHFDVVIVGAGLSGIGAGYHLQRKCPGKSYAILEGRDSHRRNLGSVPLSRHPFRLATCSPWANVQAVDRAEGDRRRAARSANTCARRRPKTASTGRSASITGSSARHGRAGCALDGGSGTHRRARAPKRSCASPAISFSCAAAITNTRAATRRNFRARDDFAGRIVHPQKWPEDLDYTGKRVVVIGSGATAVTLVPEMAKTAAHVTMLQRSPTYVVSRPAEDALANWLRRNLPPSSPIT